MEFEHVGRLPYHFLASQMHRCSELLECHPQIHNHAIAKLSIHGTTQNRTSTFVQMFKPTQPHLHNFKIMPLQNYTSTHPHVCTTTNIEERWNGYILGL